MKYLKMKYLEEFLNLKCAGDILGVAGPQKKYTKEITEAMALRKRVKDVVLKEPNKNRFVVIDLCSGNALVPLLCSFTLPVKKSIAVDRRERYRPWHKAKRFEYQFLDIYDKKIEELIEKNENVILTASHPCGNLAQRTIQLFNELEQVKYLFLMPCCVSNKAKAKYKIPGLLDKKLSEYEKWSLYLYNITPFAQLTKDNYVMSPCNCIISAKSSLEQ